MGHRRRWDRLFILLEYDGNNLILLKSCLLGGRPSVSIGLLLAGRLLPRIHAGTFHSYLKTVSLDAQHSGALMSSKLEKALYKSFIL